MACPLFATPIDGAIPDKSPATQAASKPVSGFSNGAAND
jgi:hypothetical protein